MDIKNQFTNLNKQEVERALHKALIVIGKKKKGKNISVACLKERRKNDVIGKRNSTEFYIFTLDNIMEMVVFELQHPIFKVGNRLRMQIGGLPMGGIFSV